MKRNTKKKKEKPKKKAAKKGTFKRLLFWLLLLAVLGVAVLLLTDLAVRKHGDGKILSADALKEDARFGKADCILIFGCGVKDDGTPSDMLTDRLKTGLMLYQAGAAPKILVSGDHGRIEYDEVNTMKSWLTANGVPSEDVFMDHAGFSTYESVYRADAVFEVKSAVLVTQEYHLYRALYGAEKFGIDAVGVPADLHRYRGQSVRDAREVIARCKDFVWCLFRPEPKYLGDSIPISGDGDLTNDK